jgi:glycosidase
MDGVVEDHESFNIEAQMKGNDPEDLSVWQFGNEQFVTKEQVDVLVDGHFHQPSPQDHNIYAHLGTSQNCEKWLVVLNYSGLEIEWTIPSGTEMNF